jgi:hypothetical protein
VRHKIPDHAVLNPFLLILVEILEQGLAHSLDRLAPIVGQCGKVLLDGGRFTLDGCALEIDPSGR